jgi:hypothetical protein
VTAAIRIAGSLPFTKILDRSNTTTKTHPKAGFGRPPVQTIPSPEKMWFDAGSPAGNTTKDLYQS